MKNIKDIDLQEEYTARINIVQDYIEKHLSEEFSLIELSKVANFSPYHFHRIFYSMTGETLFQFIQRIRLEKAAFMLLVNKKTDILNIALECGFSNQASFAKAFKNFFHMSASSFRSNYTESNMGKVYDRLSIYNSSMKCDTKPNDDLKQQIPYTVDIVKMPEMKAIYIRHTGPYKQDSDLFARLFTKLYQWADRRKLVRPDKVKWLTLYHDTDDITDSNKLRLSVCMTVDQEIEVSGAIGRTDIKGGNYAIGHFLLSKDEYQQAWNAMFRDWLPHSKYQPDDRLCFELYHNEGEEQSDRHRVDICIPIRPL